jgi:hypothetical protein
MSSNPLPNIAKKFPVPKPATQIRKVIFDRALRATIRTDVRHYEDNTALHPINANTWHKGLFNPKIRRVVAKHAKHMPKYRVRIPSDAMMYNVRHYTVSQGLSRFE